MNFAKDKYTKDQREWCERYEARTGFDPMMDDYEAGNVTFYEAAQKSVSWFEDHAADAMNAISNNIPGWEAAFDAKLDAREALRQH